MKGQIEKGDSRNGDVAASPLEDQERIKFRDSVDETVNQPVPWILEGLVAEREQMLIFGPPKVGKSHFALQMAVALAMGRPFLKWENGGGRQRRVLYVNFEMDEHPFMNRLVDHVLAEAGKELERSESKLPLDSTQLDKVNESIRGWLFFSEGIRKMGLSQRMIDDVFDDAKDDPVAKAKTEAFLEKWRAGIRDLKPELVIFDTLSKMHSVDESKNIEIQNVLMLIRTLAVVPDKEKGDGSEERAVAHVIVHHARKGSDYGKGDSSYLSLDSIRGGSSIRAEADVILGLGGVQKKKQGPGRRLTLEARNVAGDNIDLLFNGRRFVIGVEEKPAEFKTDEKRLEKLASVFAKKGFRSMTVLELAFAAAGGREKNDERNKPVLDMKSFIHEQAKTGQYFVIVEGDTKRNCRATGPASERSLHYGEICWLPDNSPWLQTPELQQAMTAWSMTQVKAPTAQLETKKRSAGARAKRLPRRSRKRKPVGGHKKSKSAT